MLLGTHERSVPRTGENVTPGAWAGLVALSRRRIAAALSRPEFDTGDATLDDLVGEARVRFVSRDRSARRDAVEKLWDAFERTTT